MYYSSAIVKNQLMDIGDLIAKDNTDLTPYGNVIDEMKLDGKLYGLPYRDDYWILYYNKDLFDKANIPYPTNDWTWDDFRTTARKLTSGEGTDKKYGAYIHTWSKCYYMMGLLKGQGNIVEGDYSIFRDGFQFLYDIQTKDKSAQDYATNKSLSAHYRGLFEQGIIGMAPMGTWFTGMLITDKKDGKHNINWDVVKLPKLQGQGDATMGAVTPMVINAKSGNTDAAWTLMKYICGKEGATILAQNLMMPGYRDDDVLSSYYSVEGSPAGGQEALKTSKIYLDIPVSKNSPLLQSMIDEEVQLFATGNKSVDDVVKEMNDRRTEILQKGN